jgi:hypothetical protein
MTGIIRKEPSECWIRGSENENDVVAILTSFMEYHFHMYLADLPQKTQFIRQGVETNL